MHRPEILILDEPTTGLDPQTRQLIWNVIEKLQKTENMTVFLTTHYMEEAANACLLYTSLIELMGMEQPAEMTGKSLLIKK